MKLILLATLIACCWSAGVGQVTDNRSDIVLLKRFVDLKVSLTNGELNLDVDERYKAHRGDYALRVCSEKPFIRVYETDGNRLARLLYDFRKYTSVPQEKIFLLSGNECKSSKKGIITIELWWIGGNQFPPFGERYDPCQVSKTVIAGDIHKESEYLASLSELRQRIKLSRDQGDETLGLIDFAFVRRTDKRKMNRHVIQARRILANEIKGGSAIVKDLNSSDFQQGVKAAFPIISTIEIKKQCTSK